MAAKGITVAVTGPTGEIGIPFIRALEAAEEVAEIRGMARRPFDPTSQGWKKTKYVQGDVLDRDAVDRFVEGADVVVHLAFIIFGSHDESRRVNLEGSRNVFEATVAAAAKRLVYTSSVAAYGFHPENPQPLTEDVPPRGTDDFYYSAQKAELEEVLADALAGSDLPTYIFRPSIVGGPESLILVTNLPYIHATAGLPGPLRTLVEGLPLPAPVVFDPGVAMQLVHADDVATALVAAVLGNGEPGIYNLGAAGEITMGDLAAELGWHSVPVPNLATAATAELVKRTPGMPAEAEWIAVSRIPVVMSAEKARKGLGWKPRHDTAETMRQTVAGAKAKGLVTRSGRVQQPS